MAGSGRSRTYVRVLSPLVILAVLAALWFTGLLATVRPIGSAQSLAAVMEGGTAFDKVKFVDDIWQSKVLPTVDQHSVDIGQLMTAIKKSPEAAAKEYGNNVGGAYDFLIHFAGRVTEVDSSSLTGTVTVNAALDGGFRAVKLQIGPIILGTALRDAVKFISFEQFTNQIQYGGVSDEMNSRVTRDVISKLDLKGLKGKELDVKGAFIYDPGDPSALLVTPVIVKVQ